MSNLRTTEEIIKDCRNLLSSYRSGKLGKCPMPEDSNPGVDNLDIETRLVYFTLPMSLNYQRDSYKLWQAVLNTYNDLSCRDIFSIEKLQNLDTEQLRLKLTKYKIALQPNKHINTYKTISNTIYKNWKTITKMLESVDYDFLKLKKLIQKDYKKDFPYLSGPKIFNYWSFILGEYCKIKLKNKEYIDIAPDTHII
ncbi:MAG: hypothetical protein V1824_03160, partial [archaeon]